MGQQESKEAGSTAPSDSKVNAIAAQCFAEIDKFSLKHHRSDNELLEAVGIGSPVMRRSALFLANYPQSLIDPDAIHKNVLKVIAFYNQKLPSALGLEFKQLIFLSLAIQASEVEPREAQTAPEKFYIGFADLLDFVCCCCQVYDKSPTDEFDNLPDMSAAAQQLLSPWKAPVIGLESWLEILDQFPYLLKSLETIWSQLLYEKAPTPVKQGFEYLGASTVTFIKQHQLALLCMCRGPSVLEAIKLYSARTDGFSMRSFESKVINWKAPTFLFIKGVRESLEWADVPRVTDSLPRASKRVLLCVYLDQPWKIGNRDCFGGTHTVIYQVEPEFQVYKARVTQNAYFSPDTGLGFGLLPPQSRHIRFGRQSNVALMVDRFLEHAVFRCVGSGMFDQGRAKAPFEDRFKLNSVEVWGEGNEQVLKAQKLAWAWEDAEARKRQGVNVGEDRSILELAGIVGQYDPDRGTN